MKKICLAVSVLLVMVLFCAVASANSWGLTGKLLNAVMENPAWNDYAALSNQEGPFAVMHSRYHNALFYVDGMDELHVYTAAVYQPDDGRKAPKIYWDGHYVTIWYDDSEYYIFCEWEEGSGEFQLSEASVNDFVLSGIPGESGFSWQYVATDADSDTALVLPEKIMLSNFNIHLSPRSLDEVRHLNYMLARFDSGLNILGADSFSGSPYDPDHPGEPMRSAKEGTAAVYSAPYGESAWRAGKGKAAVGLSGDMWLLSQYRNEEGQSYACIRYDVSERTQRIGYVLCRDIGFPEIAEQSTEPGSSFVHIDVEASADTYLTDDPDVGQFAQFTVPKGTQFSCLGFYNDYYAYVAAEVKDGKFTDGGAVVWGFVPTRDLKPMEREHLSDVMTQMSGSWLFESGGSLAPDVLHLNADGTFTAEAAEMSEGEDVVTEGALSGTWYVTAYNPFMNLYWNQPPYELTLLFDNGRAIVRGLTLTDDGFGLTYWEGDAGYIPYGGTIDSADDHG